MPNQKILLIDYEPRSIEKVARPLRNAGFTVEIASDGLAGMEAFDRVQPDLVLVEAMIPKKHGFEVCQDLKRTPRGKRTPILITTSVYKGRKYRTQALHIYGCDEYIEKPVDEGDLLEVVRRFLGAPEEPRADASPQGELPQSVSEAVAMVGASRPSASARATVPKFASNASAKGVSDLTEVEIDARLDAILSGEPDRSSNAPERASNNTQSALERQTDPEATVLVLDPEPTEATPVSGPPSSREGTADPSGSATEDRRADVVNFEARRSKRKKRQGNPGNSARRSGRGQATSEPVEPASAAPPPRAAGRTEILDAPEAASAASLVPPPTVAPVQDRDGRPLDSSAQDALKAMIEEEPSGPSWGLIVLGLLLLAAAAYLLLG